MHEVGFVLFTLLKVKEAAINVSVPQFIHLYEDIKTFLFYKDVFSFNSFNAYKILS